MLNTTNVDMLLIWCRQYGLCSISPPDKYKRKIIYMHREQTHLSRHSSRCKTPFLHHGIQTYVPSWFLCFNVTFCLFRNHSINGQHIFINWPIDLNSPEVESWSSFSFNGSTHFLLKNQSLQLYKCCTLCGCLSLLPASTLMLLAKNQLFPPSFLDVTYVL